jgi:DNA primase
MLSVSIQSTLMAGRIPQQFIDELMSRVDIVDLIDSRVPLRKTGRDYMARCPFHDEKSPSFTVSPAKQFYHCFGCGAHGTALGFLMAYEHMDFGDAVRELAAKTGMEIPQSVSSASDTASHDPLYQMLDKAAIFFRNRLRDHPQAVDYLKQRGLSGATAAEFAVGFAPPGWDNLLSELGKTPKDQALLVEAGLIVKKDKEGYYDRFRNRIMFPIRDRRGRIIAFGGRVLEKEGNPKYLNSPETPVFHKGRELYGLHEAQKALRRLEKLVVVEGYMDVVALAQHGIRYAVATLGTATSAEHVERLFRLTPDVVFCFDGDRAGRDAARRALENVLPAMREGREARFLFLPEGEDPDSLVRKEGKDRFEERIAQSVPFSTFFYEVLTRQADISSMEGRARLVELAKPGLSKLPPGVLKHMMMIKLAELSQLDANVVAQTLGMARPQTTPSPTLQAKTRQSHPQRPAMSPLRSGISLLLHTPSLAALAGEPHRWERLDIPGVNLLIAMLELLQSQPHLHSGALLERWRDTPEGTFLAELAKWDPLLPTDGLEAEFRGVVQWLDTRLAEQRREELHAKWQRDGLSPAEKTEFVELQRRCAGSAPATPH